MPDLAIGSVNAINGVTATSLFLNVASGKSVSQSQAISVTNLALQGTSATYSLTNAANRVGTLAANTGTGTGSISLSGTNGLIINTANSVNGVTTGTLTLSNTGAVTQNATNTRRISATNLELLGAGGSYALTNTSNSIGTLAADTGSINVVDSAGLACGAAGGTTGVKTSGAATVVAAGNLTIAAIAQVLAAGDIVLSATGNFINNRGSDAVSASGGRWLIYSGTPGSDTFGGLDSRNTAIWNGTYASLPPASVSVSGNHYLFAFRPTLTVTSTDVSKTYGDDVTATVAAAYSLSGLQASVAGAFLGDSFGTVASGAPSVTSAGSNPTASVAGSRYAITAAQGTLTALTGYAFAFNSAGRLTVNPKALTVALTGTVSKSYDGTTAATLAAANYGLAGVVNGDSVGLNNPVSGSCHSRNAGTGKLVSVTRTSLTGAGAGNYTVAGAVSGNVGTIKMAALTIAWPPAHTKVYDGMTGSTATPTVGTLSNT